MKKISTISTLVSSILLVSLLTACGEEKTKEQAGATEQSATTVTKTAASTDGAPMIEVVANKNAEEIKVASKTASEDQSKSFYYHYHDTSAVNEEQKTAIDANINVRSPYEKIEISMLVKKLSKEFIVKCSACHNDYANGVIGPSLLGKSADYIYDEIAKFKTGKRENVLMTDLIKGMENEEIRKLAEEIFEFNEQIKEMRK